MIKIFFILNRKVTPQKNGCVGCWLLALPRAQMTRLSRILGVWFTYYVPVLINFMTPSKHLSIAYQGINLRRLLRFFFLSKARHAIEDVCKDDRSVRFYTGIPSLTCLLMMFNFLQPVADLKYWDGKKKTARETYQVGQCFFHNLSQTKPRYHSF